ncbi:MAG: ribose 5-phosphate isomerase B [Oscillospiraceae bacterium]|nr:ribose 5-phosphate isomerase B [Oscillospiraceae bacterium]
MIAIACDHGALTLKNHLKAYLEGKGFPCRDFGTFTPDSCDYPDFAVPAALAVASGECERGIVLCTTGIGASIAANKVPGVRCALCREPWSAEMTRRHNDANVLALGAGATGPNLAERIVDVFLSTEFEGGRHQRRIDKISALEK